MAQALHVRSQGEAHAPALLLIHALGTDSRFWDECVARWSPHYRCIAPDLRSAGLSPLPDPPIGIAEHCADLEALRAELGVSPVVIMGCAMGGLVAAGYAACHPEHVAALVMTNPGLRNADEVKDMLRRRVDLVRDRGMEALLPAAAERAFQNLPHDRRYELYVSRYRAQSAEAYARSVLGFLDVDISADLPKVRCPTLVIAGEHDVLMPPDSSARIKEILPDAEMHVLRDAAHFVPFQAPDRFAELVETFLDRIPGFGPS